MKNNTLEIIVIDLKEANETMKNIIQSLTNRIHKIESDKLEGYDEMTQTYQCSVTLLP